MEHDEGATQLLAALLSGLGTASGSLLDGSGGGLLAWHWWEARYLLAAEATGSPRTLLSERRPGLTVEDGYRVQWCGAAIRVAQGARVAGHKVGLTSAAMQQQMGIGEPDSGILLDTMAVPDGGLVDSAAMISPRVEAEIAFLLRYDLAGPDVGEDQARAAIAGAKIALEIIDSRFGLPGIALADSVADNAACARFVLGEQVPIGGPDGLDLCAEELTVYVGGHPVERGHGRAILGDPIRSVVWLTRRLAGFGLGMRAGDIVLAGAVHASIPLPAGQAVTASSPRLGQVSLDVADSGSGAPALTTAGNASGRPR